MIALRIQINDEDPVVAGSEDLSVLSAVITASGRLGASTANANDVAPRFHINVSGLTSRAEGADEHLRWLQRWNAKPGDRITIELLDCAVAQEPGQREVVQGKAVRSDPRALYEQTKKMYFDLKELYEPEAARHADS